MMKNYDILNSNNRRNKKNKSSFLLENKKFKDNEPVVVILLLVLVFTSFFVLSYMKKIEKDVKGKVNIDGKVIELKTSRKKDSKLDLSEIYHKSYMNGYSDNTFRPNQSITRGEVAYLISRLDDIYEENKKYYSAYDDELGEYVNSISFCSEYGIMDEKSDNMFMPYAQVTREEFLTILAKYKKCIESLDDVNLNEVNKNWYDTYTDMIKNTKIEDNKANIDSKQYLSRAEACSIINKTFDRKLSYDEKVKQKIMNIEKFDDVDEDDWYFEDVIEATFSHERNLFHDEYMSEDKNKATTKSSYPVYHYIDFKTGLLQNPELPTGCEITSLAQLLNFYGYQIDKVNLSDKYLSKVGVGESDFQKDFVGNPKTNNGFGCYAQAIKDACERYFNENETNEHKPINLSGYEIEKIYELISKGYPINVWVTRDLIKSNKNFVWIHKDRSIYWTLNEHCVTLIGYDKTKSLVYVSDPLVGILSYDMTTFEHRYKELGRQAFMIAKTSDDIEEKEQSVEKIEFTNGLSTMYVGNIHELNIIVEPPYAQNVNLVWKSSNPDVISVSSTGTISANSIGEAIVSIEADNNVKAELTIAVK